MTNDSRCPPMLNYEFRFHEKPLLVSDDKKVEVSVNTIRTVDHDSFYRMILEIHQAVFIPMLDYLNDRNFIIPKAAVRCSWKHIRFRWDIHIGDDFVGEMWIPVCKIFRCTNRMVQAEEVIYDYAEQADSLSRFLQDYERDQGNSSLSLPNAYSRFLDSKIFHLNFDEAGNLVNLYRTRRNV